MKPIREIVSTLQSEARFRPTIWGDARPLLIEAADAIVFLQNSLTAARTALRTIALGNTEPEHVACEALDELMDLRSKRP